MRRSKYLSNAISGLSALVFLTSAFVIAQKQEKPFVFVSKQKSSLNFDNRLLENFNLGQKRLISSLLWIATILESDQDHYKSRDLNSWMHLRFLTISKLEPNFLYNYIFGGQYLSIIKDDLDGATDIYDRGLKLFPDEFKLLQDAGFHFYFEVGDFAKALPIYERLSQHPQSSSFMVSTLARLKSNQGNLEDAFKLLESKYLQIEDKTSLPALKLREHLYALKAEIDLSCLNSSRSDKKNSCSTADHDGNPYIKENDQKYSSLKPWNPLRIKTKKPSPAVTSEGKHSVKIKDAKSESL